MAEQEEKPAEAPVEDAMPVVEAAAEAATSEAASAEAASAEAVDQDDAEAIPEEETKPVNPNLRWYVVHTYSGYENRAKKSLEERIRQDGVDELFGEVLIPTENVVELGKGGTRRTTKRKFFPGYMLVQLELTDITWHTVKGTPKVTGFIGAGGKPAPVPEAEVRRLTKQISEGELKPKPRIVFEEGEDVRVVDGPFANFNGVVETVNHDKGRVRVLVSIFGRSTPVELDFVQVEKA